MRIVACTIACLGLVGAGLASEPRIEKAGAKVRLSRVLPERLSAFVTRTGTDRDLTDAEAVDVTKLKAGEASVEVIEKLLRPAEVVEHDATPLTVDGARYAKQADGTHHAVDPVLVAASKVVLGDGSELEVGDLVLAGDTIVRGIVLNAGDTEVILTNDAGETVLVPPGGVIAADCDPGCSVTCNPGFYACCRSIAGCTFCTCRADGSPSTGCTQGGPGSSGCSVGKTQ